MTYGKRLDEALTRAKKSRRELAEHLGCKVQAIGMVITGGGKVERSLSVVNHVKAARFLRVDSYWLATGDGEPTPSKSAPLSQMALDLGLAFDEELASDKERSKAYIAMMAVVNKIVTERAVLPSASPLPHPKTPHG